MMHKDDNQNQEAIPDLSSLTTELDPEFVNIIENILREEGEVAADSTQDEVSDFNEILPLPPELLIKPQTEPSPDETAKLDLENVLTAQKTIIGNLNKHLEIKIEELFATEMKTYSPIYKINFKKELTEIMQMEITQDPNKKYKLNSFIQRIALSFRDVISDTVMNLITANMIQNNIQQKINLIITSKMTADEQAKQFYLETLQRNADREKTALNKLTVELCDQQKSLHQFLTISQSSQPSEVKDEVQIQEEVIKKAKENILIEALLQSNRKGEAAYKELQAKLEDQINAYIPADSSKRLRILNKYFSKLPVAMFNNLDDELKQLHFLKEKKFRQQNDISRIKTRFNFSGKRPNTPADSGEKKRKTNQEKMGPGGL